MQNKDIGAGASMKLIESSTRWNMTRLSLFNAVGITTTEGTIQTLS